MILAKGFDILDGRVEITVPWVMDREDYSVVRKYYDLAFERSRSLMLSSLRRLWKLQPRVHDPLQLNELFVYGLIHGLWTLPCHTTRTSRTFVLHTVI